MKLRTKAAVFVGALLACTSVVGCNDGDRTLVGAGTSASTSSLRLQLGVGSEQVGSVTATISGPNGFVTQTHTLEVNDADHVVSIFFGSLPVGNGYQIQLTAGSCSALSSFDVLATQTTLVSLTLSCAPKETGSVQVTGTLPPDAGADSCDHVTKIVATPSIQNGDGGLSTIQLQLNADVVPASIAWTVSSLNGGAGTLSNLAGNADLELTFDCSGNGTAFVKADVSAPEGGVSCTEQAQVAIECVNQVTVPVLFCGDNLINQATEQCDGTTLPAAAPAGSTCSASCTLVLPQPPEVGLCQQSCVNDLVNNGACNGVFTPLGPESDPVIDCILSAAWPSPNTFPAASCANGNLLSCYCGTLTPSQCATALPADIAGAQCKNEILVGTGCSARPAAEQSTCVGQLFVNPGNAAGRALAYIQCLQDNCPDICFAP